MCLHQCLVQVGSNNSEPQEQKVANGSSRLTARRCLFLSFLAACSFTWHHGTYWCDATLLEQ